MDDRGAGVDGVRVGPPAEVGCQKAALEKLSNPSLGRIFGQQVWEAHRRQLLLVGEAHRCQPSHRARKAAAAGGAPTSATTLGVRGGAAARDGALGNPGSPIYTRFIGYFLVILRWRVREARQHWPSRWACRAGADSGPPIAEAHVGWRRDECAWRAWTARDGAFVTF
ncbi:hypothetical protein C8F04DRAFT_1178216 [Mycena alexandri]|uniref:Uncharacterized protein n=1 Tax=Mycena alexandri TaxID=1745969 RepID=A0AAD6X9R5_9AGAR|nr:hypothetical protein C8F04DRAFT_1178216 [Mycena alexandri]